MIDGSCLQQIQPHWGKLMRYSVINLVKRLGVVAIGLTIAIAGIYIGETDDAGRRADRHPAANRYGGAWREDCKTQDCTEGLIC